MLSFHMERLASEPYEEDGAGCGLRPASCTILLTVSAEGASHQRTQRRVRSPVVKANAVRLLDTELLYIL